MLLLSNAGSFSWIKWYNTLGKRLAYWNPGLEMGVQNFGGSLNSWVRLIIRGIVRNFQRESSHQFSPPEYCRLFALERLMKEGYGHPWTLPSLVTPLFTNSYSASLSPEILMCTSELSGKPDKMVGVGGGGGTCKGLQGKTADHFMLQKLS